MTFKSSARTSSRTTRHVRQRHSTGCGIAAAATLAGISYARAYREYRTLFPDEPSHRTDSPEIRTLVRRFGVRLGRLVRTHRWTMLKRRCLVAVNYDRKTDHWHWVVFEPTEEGGYVLDSKSKRPGGRRQDFRRMRLAWYHMISTQM